MLRDLVRNEDKWKQAQPVAVEDARPSSPQVTSPSKHFQTIGKRNKGKAKETLK